MIIHRYRTIDDWKIITHSTITDVIDREVTPALGEYADDFDAEAIAREISDYQPALDGFALLDLDHDEFWEIAFSHRLDTDSDESGE